MSKTFKDSKGAKQGRPFSDRPKPKMTPYKKSTKVKEEY